MQQTLALERCIVSLKICNLQGSGCLMLFSSFIQTLQQKQLPPSSVCCILHYSTYLNNISAPVVCASVFSQFKFN